MAKKDDKKKRKKFSEHDPEKYINLEPISADTFKESKNSTTVVSFGRFNPITTGHEKLANKVIAEAISKKAMPMIFLSHTQDKKKNPLSYEDKIKYARKAFGSAVVKSKAKSIIEVAKELTGKFDNLVVVAGQDRAKEFETLLNKYNGKEYQFDSIEVVSAGQRDPDSEGVQGISASKMRKFAEEGNFEDFKKGLPRKLASQAKEIYDNVRSGLNLSEEYLDERAPLSLAQRRKRGRVMRRHKSKIAAARKRARRRRANPQKLKQRAQRKARDIIRKRLSKNKKYSQMSASEKIALDKRMARIPQSMIARIARKELPKVKRAEMQKFSNTKKEDLNSEFENFMIEKEDSDVGHMKGSQPKDYYKGVKKSVKDDRARHFKRHSKMDDDNPKAYKKAPGDEGAETKTSKHTKKFKQMFGEASLKDMVVKKKPHMGLKQNGSVKLDRRFKIFKKQMNLDEDFSEENLLDQIQELHEEIELLDESSKKSIKKKSEKTGIPYSILKDVFDRGVAAWRTGHRPGTTPTQWGLARVNSFATKGKGTWGKADKDLAAKARKAMKEEAENRTTVFTLDEMFEMRNLDEASIVDKAIEKMHKYVIQGTELGDIAYQISRAAGVNLTGRELEKKYIQKYGKPQKEKVPATRAAALRKKYGFSEAKETQFEYDSYKTLNFDICPSAKDAFEKNAESVKDKRKLLDAVKAVDRYLGIEKDLRLKDDVTADDLDKMTDAVDAAKEEIQEAGLKGHNYHDIHVDNVKDMTKNVNENEATERAKARIKAEKERDARKHDRMMDRAKIKDTKTKLAKEASENPNDREWGTDSLTKTYKKDTPGEKDIKEESPYMKDFARGSRVRFRVDKITGEDYSEEGNVVGTDPDTLRLKVRDDDKVLHIVKHEDAELI